MRESNNEDRDEPGPISKFLGDLLTLGMFGIIAYTVTMFVILTIKSATWVPL